MTKDEDIESRFRAKLVTPEAIVNYNKIPETKGGKVLDVDLARWLCKEYAEGDMKDRTRWTGATHSPASDFIQMLYEKKLKEATTGGAVIFLAGGAGSGKSSIVEGMLKDLIELADVVLDGTLSWYDSAKDRVELALKSGMDVTIAYVHRPFAEAVRGVSERFAVTGRVVPAKVLTESHAGAQDVVARLQNEYQGDERVQFIAIDNSGANAAVITMAQLAEKCYDTTRAGMRATAERLLPIAKKGLPYDD